MKRRSFLKGAGVVTVVVVGAGVWRAHDQGVFSVGEGPAYEPWKNWRNTNEGPLTLVRAAILAASPHNTQPWLFKVSNSSIELHIDTQRNVGALDPYLREEHIGIGCALENLTLAAAANGPSLGREPRLCRRHFVAAAFRGALARYAGPSTGAIKNAPTDDAIYYWISISYIERAKSDPNNRMEWLKLAREYSEKSLIADPNDQLNRSAIARLFELMGDIQPETRCDDYKKSEMLLTDISSKIQSETFAARDKSVPSAPLRQYTDKDIARLTTKKQNAGCK